MNGSVGIDDDRVGAGAADIRGNQKMLQEYKPVASKPRDPIVARTLQTVSTGPIRAVNVNQGLVSPRTSEQKRMRAHGHGDRAPVRIRFLDTMGTRGSERGRPA